MEESFVSITEAPNWFALGRRSLGGSKAAAEPVDRESLTEN
jgi:hypothetical protein